jgi:hypothetical protein
MRRLDFGFVILVWWVATLPGCLLASDDSDVPESLECVRQISSLPDGKWQKREFHLNEHLYDALPNPAEDGIEIRVGRRMYSASTAAVSFDPNTPPQRMIEYLDFEDTNEFLPTTIVSPDGRWAAAFSPVTMNVAVYDFNDAGNQISGNFYLPRKPFRIFDLSHYMEAEKYQILSPLSFAPRLKFSDVKSAGGVPRLMLSSPYRFVDFDVEQGVIAKMQQRSTPKVMSAFYLDDAVILTELDGYTYQNSGGIGRVEVFGNNSGFLGPLHSFQMPDRDPLVIAPLYEGVGAAPRLSLLRPARDSTQPYSLEMVGHIPTEHHFPISWMSTTRQGILTYSAEDRILRWTRLIP